MLKRTRSSLLLFRLCYLSWNALVFVSGQYASTYPSPIPLVMKSPYFNIWIASDDNLTSPGGVWPIFYSGKNVSWTGDIRVDDIAYVFQGNRSNLDYTTAKTAGAYITPTRSIFTIDAGPVRLNLTYLTPIEINDWTLQSFPFAYFVVDLWSTDGRNHTVQLYSDVTGEFVSLDTTNQILWNTTQTSHSIYHQIQRSVPASLTENQEMSEDGILYFATKAVTGLTWQTASLNISRYGFLTNGSLANTSDTNYRMISQDWPVVSFAVDLGNISSTTSPVVFALGLVRDPVVTYRKGDNWIQSRSSLWWSRWNSVADAIDVFLSDFPSALSRAIALDNRIMSDASNLSLSANASVAYKDLLALNLRQTLGSLEITTSRGSSGKWAGMSDLRVFMKDVGNSRRINPVEVLYASFSAFLYLNASLAGALLQPLLEFQSSSRLYPNEYAAPDLGASWPNIQGNNTDQHLYSVENCGSMLIMALAHAQKSGDGGLIHEYYELLMKWADYLVPNALQPKGFLTSDRNGATSNLALKAILGIYAMGKINQALEIRGADSAKTNYFLNTASNYAKQWETLAFTTDHITTTYGNESSWGLVYNLYAPRLLGTNIIPETIYEAQAAWYDRQSSKAFGFGFGYDQSESLTAKAHWMLLTAGSIFNTTLISSRDSFISEAQSRPYFKFIRNKPNPSTYNADWGTTIGGISSPALGASFALLALNVPDSRTIDIPHGSLATSTTSNRLPSILGGTLGTLGGLAFLALGIFFFVRHRTRRRNAEKADLDVDPLASPRFEHTPQTATTVTPFTDVRDPHSPLSPLRREDFIVAPSSEVPSKGQEAGMIPTQTQTQDDGLRREVEQLRVEMDALRVQQAPQVLGHEEPPPGYDL